MGAISSIAVMEGALDAVRLGELLQVMSLYR